MLRSEEETRVFLSSVLSTQPHIDTAQEVKQERDTSGLVEALLNKVSYLTFSELQSLINTDVAESFLYNNFKRKILNFWIINFIFFSQ